LHKVNTLFEQLFEYIRQLKVKKALDNYQKVKKRQVSKYYNKNYTNRIEVINAI